ncbi:unnamed protein product [Leptidea sinapis]|nr:unnamed protein product [Leptidea sinapis]
MDVVKLIGKYLNTSVGSLCYNTDKTLTTVLDKENIEGLASIILRLAEKSDTLMTQEQTVLSYQWLEYMAMYANQAVNNSTLAKNFLQGINKALEKTTYLTGNYVTITDITIYYVLYPIIERLSGAEQENFMHLCRWCKNIQAQPKVCTHCTPLKFNTLTLSILAPVQVKPNRNPLWKKYPLPKQILPHELKNVKLDGPVIYHPQPFAYPGYPMPPIKGNFRNYTQEAMEAAVDTGKSGEIHFAVLCVSTFITFPFLLKHDNYLNQTTKPTFASHIFHERQRASQRPATQSLAMGKAASTDFRESVRSEYRLNQVFDNLPFDAMQEYCVTATVVLVLPVVDLFIDNLGTVLVIDDEDAVPPGDLESEVENI